LSHQPFDWPDDTDSSSSPERVLCGEHARTRDAPVCPLSAVSPSASDLSLRRRDSDCTARRDGKRLGMIMLPGVVGFEIIKTYVPPLLYAKFRSFYYPLSYAKFALSIKLLLSLVYFKDKKICKKKCVVRSTLAAEGSSPCVAKDVCPTKRDSKPELVDGMDSGNPSTSLCPVSERDCMVESAPITTSKVGSTVTNASVVPPEEKSPVSGVVTPSDFIYKPRVRCSVALSSGHSNGKHSYRSSIRADSHVSTSFTDEPSHSTQFCAHRCSRSSRQNHHH
uniref:Pecanex-like protein n=1 Tax=Hydatigena taeniaeformis TaxID=6205 RepID=A0A0R3X0N5_HYDTA